MRKGEIVGLLALLRALPIHVLAADSAVPRGVGPDCMWYSEKDQRIYHETYVRHSCKVLLRRPKLYMHLESYCHSLHIPSKRRLL